MLHLNLLKKKTNIELATQKLFDVMISAGFMPQRVCENNMIAYVFVIENEILFNREEKQGLIFMKLKPLSEIKEVQEQFIKISEMGTNIGAEYDVKAIISQPRGVVGGAIAMFISFENISKCCSLCCNPQKECTCNKIDSHHCPICNGPKDQDVLVCSICFENQSKNPRKDGTCLCTKPISYGNICSDCIARQPGWI